MCRALWIFGAALAILIISIAVSVYVPYRGFGSQGVYVDIPKGASRRTIARMLSHQGVIRNRWAFEALSRWRSRRTLQAGEYYFDQPVTTLQVFDTVANGRIYVHQLVVPEGYSMFDIADLVQREDFTTRDEFLAAARNPAPIQDLAPNAATLEGFLFPASYEFPRHPSGQEMVTAMVKRFRQEWATVTAQQSNASGLSTEQVVTLASLVERETPKPEERPIVAGVFANRLHRGVPLQCDPTVVYALEMAGQYSGTLHAENLAFESPYNTYHHIGLPPGPVANPGDASLRAALNPAETNYLYFVANTEGGHFFSETLAEHNSNVALYRRRIAEQRNAQPSLAQPQQGSVTSSLPRPK